MRPAVRDFAAAVSNGLDSGVPNGRLHQTFLQGSPTFWRPEPVEGRMLRHASGVSMLCARLGAARSGAGACLGTSSASDDSDPI
jgi:hypothetical protein